MTEEARNVDGDIVHVGGLLPTTIGGLDLIRAKLGLEPLRKWESSEAISWFVFQLRQVADTDEYFPSGKWATIQRVERMVGEAAAFKVANAGIGTV